MSRSWAPAQPGWPAHAWRSCRARAGASGYARRGVGRGIEKGRVPAPMSFPGRSVLVSLRAALARAPRGSWPTYGKVRAEAVYVMLSARRSLRIDATPVQESRRPHRLDRRAHRWMGERAEEAGIYILPETSGQKLLVQDGVVRGVRSGDKGRGRSGERWVTSSGSDVSPGSRARDGVWGHDDAAISAFGLGSIPRCGRWGSRRSGRCPTAEECDSHAGWPLRTAARYREFGGS